MCACHLITDFTDYGYESVNFVRSTNPSQRTNPNECGHESDTSTAKSTVSTRSNNHNKTELSNFLFQCKKCQYKGNSKEQFVQHVRDRHQKTLYGCEIFGCLKTFESLNGFRMHCKNYHRQQLSCDLCGYVSVTNLAKEEHLESHTKKTFVCQACGKTYTRGNDKDRHYLRRCPENPNRLVVCKHCVNDGKDGDVPGAEPGLMCHLAQEHNQQGEYLCTFCHTLFSSESRLEKHNLKCTKKNPAL